MFLVLQNLNKSFEMKKSLMETEMQKAIADLHSHGLSEEGSYVFNFYYDTNSLKIVTLFPFMWMVKDEDGVLLFKTWNSHE